MRDAAKNERPWLFLPRRMCGYCGIRLAQVGDLCCSCDEDTEAREQYAAQCAREEVAS